VRRGSCRSASTGDATGALRGGSPNLPRRLRCPAFDRIGRRMRPRETAGDRLDRLIDGLVSAAAVSAVVGWCGGAAGGEWWRAAGQVHAGGSLPEAASCFDFGSLTKPFMATLAIVLDRAGELPLAMRVGETGEGVDPRLARRTLGDLLRHRAGFQGWTPLYARCRSGGEAEALLRSGALLGGRAGTYSDLDYLLWGWTAERALGRPLAALLAERVLRPLGYGATPLPAPMAPIAPRGATAALSLVASLMGTGREVELAARQGLAVPDLGPPPLGVPQDGNARFLAGASGAAPAAGSAAGGLTVGGAAGALTLGGATRAPTVGGATRAVGSGPAPAAPAGVLLGHCGLFGTAADLGRLGAEWLAPGRLLDREAVAAALAGGGPFGLGWWRRRYRGAGGPALSADSFGHSGFAGGSLWIDPVRSRVFVLLAHRLDPAINMNRWRRRFHAAAARAFDRPDKTAAMEAQ
jgi:CubicO group peptidase (beta-lactamase class C family)